MKEEQHQQVFKDHISIWLWYWIMLKSLRTEIFIYMKILKAKQNTTGVKNGDEYVLRVWWYDGGFVLTTYWLLLLT